MTTLPWRFSAAMAIRCFLVSRLIVFGIWACVGSIHVLSAPTGNTFNDAHIVLDARSIAGNLAELALHNDAGWYYGIANHGYEKRPFDADRAANWAFFPLHPMLWRVAMIWGEGDGALVGVVLANICLLASLFLVHRLTVALGYPLRVAHGAVLFLTFAPVSYFFSMPWSESLFLLLTTATFLAATRERWALVLLLGTLACATRFAGLFLMPALLVLLWQKRDALPRRAWAAVGLMPVGTLAFMAILWRACGNALAFIDIQQAWGRQLTIPYKALGVVVAKPYFIASDWNLRPLNFAAFVAGAAAFWWLARHRREYALAAFLGLGLLAPAMTGTLTSMARYAIGLFPLAIAAGYALRHRQVERTFLVVSSALLALLALAFQQRFAFAGA